MKIDGIFVCDMVINFINYVMVWFINELCYFLDLKIIVEYVENLEIMEIFQEIQVDYVQGFGIVKLRWLDSLIWDIVLFIGVCF